jgi:hypothetical protein
MAPARESLSGFRIQADYRDIATEILLGCGFLKTQLASLALEIAGRLRLLVNIAAAAVKVKPVATPIRS